MNLKITLLTLLYLGTLISCSDSSKKEIAKEEGNRTIIIASKVDKKFIKEVERLENREKKLSLENSLEEEGLKSKNRELLAKIQQIEWEKEISEKKFELQKIKDEQERYREDKKHEKELKRVTYQADLAEAKARELENKQGYKTSLLAFEQSKLNSEMELYKVKEERKSFITIKEDYLKNPLTDENKTLIISDRRIDLNGVIAYEMADKITKQINYFNNKDPKAPIFLVIDKSPGGSIMAGNLILRAMESSNAPIYVVLKSFSASMASVIVTLADKSFSYPQAVMLHHQPMAFDYGYNNLSEMEEKHEELEKWWKAFGEPIAKKMGITIDEFKKEMYKHSLKGNWKEFAVDAHKLKWVNNIITHIEDKSIRLNPLYTEKENKDDSSDTSCRSSGDKFVNLPRLEPVDAYFIYNPDGYYRIK